MVKVEYFVSEVGRFLTALSHLLSGTKQTTKPSQQKQWTGHHDAGGNSGEAGGSIVGAAGKR